MWELARQAIPAHIDELAPVFLRPTNASSRSDLTTKIILKNSIFGSTTSLECSNITFYFVGDDSAKFLYRSMSSSSNILVGN